MLMAEVEINRLLKLNEILGCWSKGERVAMVALLMVGAGKW